MPEQKNNLAITDCELTEETFLRSERRLSTLLGNLPGMVYRCQNNELWTMEFVSAGCLELTGYRPEDLVDNKHINFGNLIHEDDRNRVWTVIQTALSQRQPFRLTYRINTLFGTQKWVWEQGVGIFAPDGTIEAIEGFITDITIRKLAERNLKQERDRAQNYLNVAGVMLLVLNSDRKVTLINKKGLEILGRQESEVIGKDWIEFIPDRFRPQMEIVLKEFFTNDDYRIDYENPIIDRDGNERLIAWHNIVLRDDHDQIEATLSSGEDITERRQKEAALCESEARFRKIFEDGPLGMATSGTDFRFTSANQAFCQMIGYSEEELMSLTFKDITHPDHLSTDAEFINKLLNGQTSNYRTEKRYLRKDGTILWGSLTVSAVHNENGDFLYFLCMINDITEHKQADIELNRVNEELKKQDKLKNEFVSTVSHELRTPLCVFKNIISNALAGVSGPISMKLKKNLEMANQNIDRLSRIINDFLDIAKIEAGRMELIIAPIDIPSLIRDVIESFVPIAASKSININTVMPNKQLVIDGDYDKLIQVLTNLIGNATKFIPSGGHILITLCDLGEQISISVHDDGPGIEAKYLDKIFNRFELGATSTRSGQPSTGLGLTISRELVELHQGRIWAENAVAHGSTFTFVLPKKQNKE